MFMKRRNGTQAEPRTKRQDDKRQDDIGQALHAKLNGTQVEPRSLLTLLQQSDEPLSVLQTLPDADVRRLLHCFLSPCHLGHLGAAGASHANLFCQSPVCPLLLALLLARDDLLPELLQRGAVVTRCWGKFNVLQSLCSATSMLAPDILRRHRALRWLLQSRPVNELWTEASGMLLQTTDEARDLCLVQLFLAAGARVTVVHVNLAAENNQSAMLRCLLDAGANPLTSPSALQRVGEQIQRGAAPRHTWIETVRLLQNAAGGQWPVLEGLHRDIDAFFVDLFRKDSQHLTQHLTTYFPFVLSLLITAYARGVHWCSNARAHT